MKIGDICNIQYIFNIIYSTSDPLLKRGCRIM